MEPNRHRFLEQCERHGVDAEDRQALWELHRRWQRAGLDEAERVRDLLEDHAHLRLYRRSRTGDAVAAGEFERHWRRYIQAFLGPCCRPQEASDIAGAFFERVYRLVGPRFHWHCPFSVYLRSLLVNLTRDALKRIGDRRRREVPIEDPADPAAGHRFPAADPSPEQELLAAERRQALQDALAAISPDERRAILAVLLEGRKVADLAAEIGISRMALYQRLHRAKRRLRARLAADRRLSKP